MMNYFSKTAAKKQVVPKVYSQLVQVEMVIEHITNADIRDTQITFLVKLGQTYNANTQDAEQTSRLVDTYWINLLGGNTAFGFFINPEIGTVFVAGPLSELFLLDIDSKKLGELTEGPYGILRGLGIEEAVAAKYIKQLNEGLCLLLIRTTTTNFDDLEDYFGNTVFNTP